MKLRISLQSSFFFLGGLGKGVVDDDDDDGEWLLIWLWIGDDPSSARPRRSASATASVSGGLVVFSKVEVVVLVEAYDCLLGSEAGVGLIWLSAVVVS